jgi:hypothetical protein
VSADYFNTLRIPMIAGRDFNNDDTSQSPRVAIVNEAFAKKVGLGANPIGARFWRGATPTTPQQLNLIVGLVKDTKYSNIRRPTAAIAYLAVAQDKDADNTMKVLVRSRLSMNEEEQAIRQTLHDMSSGISFKFDGLEDQIQQTLLPERLLARLSAFFGALAVILAMTGL